MYLKRNLEKDAIFEFGESEITLSFWKIGLKRSQT